MTRDLCSLNLLAKLMVLHCQILFSLAIAAIAEAILKRTSAEQVPFLQRDAPGHLKLVTSSNSWPFVLICAPMLFVLSVKILLFFFFFCADSICPCSVYESVGEVLQFTTAAASKIDVVGKS